MSDRERLTGRIQGLSEELALLPHGFHTIERVKALEIEIIRVQVELARLDIFTERRAELLARFRDSQQPNSHAISLPGWSGRPRSRWGKAVQAFQGRNPGRNLPGVRK